MKNKFRYQAVGDNVLLEPIPKEDEYGSVGGILVPKSVENTANKTVFVELKILSAGPDCKVAKPGMFALVNRVFIENSGAEVNCQGVKFLAIHEPALKAIVNPDAAEAVDFILLEMDALPSQKS